MEYNNTTTHSSYKRFCKTLELKNNQELIEEYKRIHAASKAWPEVTEGMKRVGIIDMEIYLVATRLFMIMDTVPDFDHEKGMAELATMPRQSEWEAFVSRFQNSTNNESNAKKWELVERIYKLDEHAN